MLKKISIASCLWLLATVFCYGQSNFTKGEELLMQNQPAQAVSFLEIAIVDEPSRVAAWLYLGIVYEQLERNDEAIAIYRRILPLAGNLSANVANNLGNVYFQRGNTEEAERFYTQAIGFDSVFSNAYLGRANTRIKTGNLQDAVSDYEQYLTLNPRSSQRNNIEQLISLVRSEIAAAELKRIIAEEEERRVAEENQRIAEENQRIAEEEERRVAEENQRIAEENQRIAEEKQRLLESVSASLQSAADYSRGLSSGAEGIQAYEGEFVLE